MRARLQLARRSAGTEAAAEPSAMKHTDGRGRKKGCAAQVGKRQPRTACCGRRSEYDPAPTVEGVLLS
jgi:hypothetical protein